MATCMQHLYMIPEARKAIIEAVPTAECKSKTSLLELQKLFVFLLVNIKKHSFISVTSAKGMHQVEKVSRFYKLNIVGFLVDTCNWQEKYEVAV